MLGGSTLGIPKFGPSEPGQAQAWADYLDRDLDLENNTARSVQDSEEEEEEDDTATDSFIKTLLCHAQKL